MRNWCPFPFTAHFKIIYHIFSNHLSYDALFQCYLGIRVITKLPNTEQSAKGKCKTHRSTNRQNQSTSEKLGNPNDPDFVQAFPKKWWVESDFTAPNLPLPLKGFGCHQNSILNSTVTNDMIYCMLNWLIYQSTMFFNIFQTVFRQSLTNSDLFRFQIIAIRAITMYRYIYSGVKP